MKLKQKLLIPLIALIQMPLMAACFGSYQINHLDYSSGLNLDMNVPGNSRNLSVPISSSYELEADYLREHTISLMATDPSKPNEPPSIGTGFVLNALSDTADGGGTSTGTNTNQAAKILVGTNLHVAKLFFPTANLKTVNTGSTPQNGGTATTPNSPALSNDKNFYFSLFDYKTANSIVLPDGTNSGNFNLYQTPTTSSNGTSNVNSNSTVPENTYQKLESSNVKLIYTATNLSLNKKIFAFDENINAFSQYRDDIINENVNDVDWVKSYNPTLSNPFQNDPKLDNQASSQFNFGVDFAVLELTIPANLQSPHFKSLLMNMQAVGPKSALPVNYSFFLSESHLTQQFLVGGVYGYSEKQRWEQEVNLAQPSFTLQSNAAQTTPSTINPTNFNTHVTVGNLKAGLKITDLTFLSLNDQTGVITFSYNIETTDNDLKIKTKQPATAILSGFKASGNSQTITNPSPPTFNQNSPRSKWLEVEVNNGVFDDTSIASLANNLWNKKVTTQQTNESDLNEVPGILNYNNYNFLSVGQNVSVPGLNMHPGSSGSLVISKSWRNPGAIGTGTQLIGLYRGVSDWMNPINQRIQSTGDIVLFSSPFRYDLFSQNNKLSHPSLCDVLNSKSLLGKLTNQSSTCPTFAQQNNS